MNKEEMICKNCKYHYIEEISFDYPQSCCSKRQSTTEEWCKCNAFEYSDSYIKQLQKENNKQKEVIDKVLEYIKEYKELGYSEYYENEIEIELIDKILKVLGGD